MASRVSALFTAAARGNLTAVRLVLEHGDAGGARDVDAKTADARGDTALHVAAAHLRWPVVSWLAANGADPDARNIAGHTALDVIPSAEGKDVYVAILARAPSPRANRVASRIPAFSERFRGDDERAAFDGDVFEREARETGIATAGPRATDTPRARAVGVAAGRVEPRDGDRWDDDERAATRRETPRRALAPNPTAPATTLRETLRSDLAAVRDAIGSSRRAEERSERAVATTERARAAETPKTTRRALRRLDRGGEDVAPTDDEDVSEDDERASTPRDRRDDDENDEDDGRVALVPKRLLRRAAAQVRRMTADLKAARVRERRAAGRLESAEAEAERWRRRAADAEEVIRELRLNAVDANETRNVG